MSGRINNLYFWVTVGYLFLSCAKPVEIIIPDDPVYPTAGTATVDNKAVANYTGSGFLFSTAQVIFYPNTSEVFPDISARVSAAPAYMPQFWSIDGSSAFKLLDSSPDSSTAFAFFDSLAAIGDTSGFGSPISGLAAYRTVAVRAHQNKYAKILITKITVDSSNSIIETTFKWVYQPDGSLIFPSP
ncbi:MAG: hypothetical protein A2509_03520 [Candidatus Edwardsbacteria bacterium RIFOXYD12_FULL_50_11]|uniref:Uncharacterized protein n=1 Tax=Candidatus Edwardsbacteria bacterium GWF2_54_11 TaxID=1817851 RepID=A0A1F5R7X7_9BACT|nr:MAG: hypothetical protein A2502_03435 [Candidatus Edwardsbacteria bacterium RifOxyC12_full_54_24]OGF07766.1 MAG: hypothetical protein A2273_04685 [Candidatus Edwardsbacteria bacterium RifOxyA12_full_54_48]OGF10014.1 MAG: hypothetical protein A3K15_11095 [Candidatus Edwardsbacteria bacterium GWE2_54_12]OGF10516.1 MAG: hypothetical protein A2024_09215 [Candidatus Edwardsbacteria bacterium GWF2_54_11]OGF14926.1 MAG: hypothetical protein A2509_03520 [Candidatus Edwardsbacteria bacterium RIFOXYD1